MTVFEDPTQAPDESPLSEPQAPPLYLYYPTSSRFLGAIHTGGLRGSKERLLHLFDDVETASSLASSLGERVIVTVLATTMWEQGYNFWPNTNGVWLTDSVPAEFLL